MPDQFYDFARPVAARASIKRGSNVVCFRQVYVLHDSGRYNGADSSAPGWPPLIREQPLHERS